MFDNLPMPEVIAGISLAMYFVLRGSVSLFRNGHSKGNGNGITLSSIAQEHIEQKMMAREESLISRREFDELQKMLSEIKLKVEKWDDMIHHGDFGCHWTLNQVTLAIDKLERIEKKLNEG